MIKCLEKNRVKMRKNITRLVEFLWICITGRGTGGGGSILLYPCGVMQDPVRSPTACNTLSSYEKIRPLVRLFHE